MTKEVQIGIVIGLTLLGAGTILISEGIFHGLYILFGFGTIGVLYIVFTIWSDTILG